MRYGEWIARGALALIFLLNGVGIVDQAAGQLPEECRDGRRPVLRRISRWALCAPSGRRVASEGGGANG